MRGLINILRVILLPLSVVYYLIITLRNFLYDKNILKSVDFKTPIISVGNITTGGTGKTPFVIFLAEHFIEGGKKVGVISRGYKSEADSLIISHDGKEVKAGIKKTGDEHGMIVNRFSNLRGNFFSIAFHNRLEAIKKMEIDFSPNVIILDDAFQNRKIKKKEILLVNKERENFLDSILLPAGNLRERKSALNRADLVMYNYKFKTERLSEENSMFYTNTGFYDADGNRYEDLEFKKAAAISGIADNESFLNAVRKSGFDIKKVFEYADHYSYSVKDIKDFENAYEEGVIYLTTEKDFVKIKEFREFVSKFPVYYLRIDVNLSENAIERIDEIFN